MPYLNVRLPRTNTLVDIHLLHIINKYFIVDQEKITHARSPFITGFNDVNTVFEKHDYPSLMTLFTRGFKKSVVKEDLPLIKNIYQQLIQLSNAEDTPEINTLGLTRLKATIDRLEKGEPSASSTETQQEEPLDLANEADFDPSTLVLIKKRASQKQETPAFLLDSPTSDSRSPAPKKRSRTGLRMRPRGRTALVKLLTESANAKSIWSQLNCFFPSYKNAKSQYLLSLVEKIKVSQRTDEIQHDFRTFLQHAAIHRHGYMSDQIDMSTTTVKALISGLVGQKRVLKLLGFNHSLKADESNVRTFLIKEFKDSYQSHSKDIPINNDALNDAIAKEWTTPGSR